MSLARADCPQTMTIAAVTLDENKPIDGRCSSACMKRIPRG
jgi:hypothetical protein